MGASLFVPSRVCVCVSDIALPACVSVSRPSVAASRAALSSCPIKSMYNLFIFKIWDRPDTGKEARRMLVEYWNKCRRIVISRRVNFRTHTTPALLANTRTQAKRDFASRVRAGSGARCSCNRACVGVVLVLVQLKNSIVYCWAKLVPCTAYLENNI